MTTAGPESTRLAIRRSAEVVFGASGYRRANVADIASAAGVSRALVYRYYEDKPTLFRAVVTELLTEWNDALVAVVEEGPTSALDTLRELLTACTAWAAERPLLRGVLLRDAELARRVAGDAIDEGRDLLPRLVRTVVERGVRTGELRADLGIDEITQVVTDLAIASSLRAIAGTRTDDAAAADILLHGVATA